MTKVFIGGSRAVSRINSVLTEKLDHFMARGCRILVGDAKGADKAVQQYLHEREYRNVLVYCTDSCRNNLGMWETKHITGPGRDRDFAYYAAKDAAMAQESDCGVMLWDGKSKGTLNNIQALVDMGKKTLVYFAPQRAFHRITGEADLAALLLLCDGTSIEQAQHRIRRALPTGKQIPLGEVATRT